MKVEGGGFVGLFFIITGIVVVVGVDEMLFVWGSCKSEFEEL